MKLLLAIFSFISSMVYLTVAMHVRTIWPGPSEIAEGFREAMWGFGAGIFFTIAIVEIIAFVKENR